MLKDVSFSIKNMLIIQQEFSILKQGIIILVVTQAFQMPVVKTVIYPELKMVHLKIKLK